MFDRVKVTHLLHFVFCSYYTEYMRGEWATFEYEQKAREAGYGNIAGIDEVGRGAVAGPVSVGLVVLPEDFQIPVTDSKLLSPKQRAEKAALIVQAAIVCEVMHIEAKYIDQHGIMAAQRQAVQRIWEMVDPLPAYVLLDGRYDFTGLGGAARVETIVHGDRASVSIAAASIVAKHARDELMRRYALMYPEYGFEMHVGYGTPNHLAAIRRHGLSPLHRRSFLQKYIQG